MEYTMHSHLVSKLIILGRMSQALTGPNCRAVSAWMDDNLSKFHPIYYFFTQFSLHSWLGFKSSHEPPDTSPRRSPRSIVVMNE
jgi:hypothetical protein